MRRGPSYRQDYPSPGQAGPYAPWFFPATALIVILFLLLGKIARGAEPAAVCLPTVRAQKVGEFWVAPDPRSRTAWYCFEVITHETLAGDGVRKDQKFHGEPTIARPWRAVKADYDGSKWAMGHLARAGNYGEQAAKDATFTLVNAAPQDPQFNSVGWNAIEVETARQVDRDHYVAIFTLPLVLPDADGVITIPTIGKHNVWVPTHWAKAVLVVRGTPEDAKTLAGEPERMLAWCCPNRAIVNTAAYRVPVDELEPKAGFDLFAWLPEAVQDRLEARP